MRCLEREKKVKNQRSVRQNVRFHVKPVCGELDCSLAALGLARSGSTGGTSDADGTSTVSHRRLSLNVLSSRHHATHFAARRLIRAHAARSRTECDSHLARRSQRGAARAAPKATCSVPITKKQHKGTTEGTTEGTDSDDEKNTEAKQ